MELNHLNIEELFSLRSKLILENASDKEIGILNRIIDRKEKDYSKFLNEDTSATGGPAGSVSGGSVGSGGVSYSNNVGGGMGPVVNAQPSSLAGSTIGADWADNGGTIGSGDVSVPYPGSTGKKDQTMFQKIEMGKNHGARTGKKSRIKKLDLKALKNVFAKRQDFTTGASTGRKVLNFQDFQKDSINKVTKAS